MDVHCSSCGEPWDTYHLRHDAIHETDLTEEEIAEWRSLPSEQRLRVAYREALQAAGYEFGSTMMNVIKCTACPPGARPDPATVHLKAELESILADDEDGLASEFDTLQR